MLREQPRVAIAKVDRPRADEHRVLPRRAAVHVAQEARHRRRDVAVRALRIVDVVLPFGEERRDIHVERRCAHEHLRVAGPAQALVALRAVRGHFQEVAALAPLDVVLELVQERVRARELARRRRVRVQHDPDDRLQLERLAAGDLHVTEPVEREARLPRFLSLTRAGVIVRAARGAQVFGVGLAVLVEDFDVAQTDRRAALGAHGDPHPAHHVLAQVDEPAAEIPVGIRRFRAGNLGQFHGPAHGRTRRRDDLARLLAAKLDGQPCHVVEPRGAPRFHRAVAAREAQARVERFAHDEIVLHDRAAGGFPVRAGGEDGAGAAVRACHGEERAQLRAVAVGLAVGAPGVAAVPAVAENGPGGVLAGAQERGHVVHVVLHAMVVIRPARAEHVAAHDLAVEIELMHPQRRDVQPSGGDAFG